MLQVPLDPTIRPVERRELREIIRISRDENPNYNNFRGMADAYIVGTVHEINNSPNLQMDIHSIDSMEMTQILSSSSIDISIRGSQNAPFCPNLDSELDSIAQNLFNLLKKKQIFNIGLFGYIAQML